MNRAPATPSLRLLLWWLRGGPATLRDARARRVARFGAPGAALVAVFGVHTGAAILVEVIRGVTSLKARLAICRGVALRFAPPRAFSRPR